MNDKRLRYATLGIKFSLIAIIISLCQSAISLIDLSIWQKRIMAGIYLELAAILLFYVNKIKIAGVDK